jgi:hypothetical protein
VGKHAACKQLLTSFPRRSRHSTESARVLASNEHRFRIEPHSGNFREHYLQTTDSDASVDISFGCFLLGGICLLYFNHSFKVFQQFAWNCTRQNSLLCQRRATRRQARPSASTFWTSLVRGPANMGQGFSVVTRPLGCAEPWIQSMHQWYRVGGYRSHVRQSDVSRLIPSSLWIMEHLIG